MFPSVIVFSSVRYCRSVAVIAVFRKSFRLGSDEGFLVPATLLVLVGLSLPIEIFARRTLISVGKCLGKSVGS